MRPSMMWSMEKSTDTPKSSFEMTVNHLLKYLVLANMLCFHEAGPPRQLCSMRMIKLSLESKPNLDLNPKAAALSLVRVKMKATVRVRVKPLSWRQSSTRVSQT